MFTFIAITVLFIICTLLYAKITLVSEEFHHLKGEVYLLKKKSGYDLAEHEQEFLEKYYEK